MKSLFGSLLLSSALALSTVFATGCTSDSEVDSSNGKAISDLDIGSDMTLDQGKTQQARATVKYADGTSADVTKSSDLVWNVGNASVATITSDGVVTAVSKGATTIKATYQGKESASHALIVH